MTVSISAIADDVDPSLRTGIDFLGEAEAAYKAAKQVVKDYENLRKETVAQVTENVPDDQSRIVRGDKYLLDLGPKAEHRTIKNLSALIKILGADTFLEVAKVNISDIENLVPHHLLGDVLETKRSGSRSVKIGKL